MDRGAWWAAVHRVAQGQTRLKRLGSSSSILVSKVAAPIWILINRIQRFSTSSSTFVICRLSVIATLVQKIYMHPNVRSSIIYGSQGMEAPVFINSWVDKENVYLYILLLFSHQIVSDFLQPHGLQCTRPPCPFSSLRVCSSSCPLNRWCHTNVHTMLYIYTHTHTYKMEY